MTVSQFLFRDQNEAREADTWSMARALQAGSPKCKGPKGAACLVWLRTNWLEFGWSRSVAGAE